MPVYLYLYIQVHWEEEAHQAGGVCLEPQGRGTGAQDRVAVPGEGQHLQTELEDLPTVYNGEVSYHALKK